MPTVVVSATASGPDDGGGDFVADANEIVFAGDNADEGFINSSEVQVIYSNDSEDVDPAPAGDNLSGPYYVEAGSGASVPSSGGTWEDLNNPVAVFIKDPVAQPMDGLRYDHIGVVAPSPGNCTLSVTMTMQYTRVRPVAIAPTLMNPAGGELITLSGDGFLPGVVSTRNYGDLTPFVQSITIGDESATEVTVIDNNTLTFRAPANLAPTATLPLRIWYDTVSRGTYAFPVNATFDVSYTAASWWFNPTSQHYVYAAESPGAPFVARDAPPITITDVSPRST